MKIEQCTNGLYRLAMATVGVLLVSLAIGCGDSDCPDHEQLVEMEGQQFCASTCEAEEDCTDEEDCRQGYCVTDSDLDDDDDDNGDDNGDDECTGPEDCEGDDMVCEDGECVEDDDNGNGNGNGDACNAQEACTDYCEEKFGRCMREDCQEFDTTIEDPETGAEEDVNLTPEDMAQIEVENCMEGLEGEMGETLIEGCVDTAQISDAACESVEQQAEEYADQPCDGDEQEARRCREMDSDLVTLAGNEIFENCGCESANTVGECTEDSDCDEYGYGQCIDGMCVAECVNPFEGADDDDVPTIMPPDAYCGTDATQGCLLWPLFAQQALPGLPENTCMQLCEGRDDCPMGDDSACVPLGGEDEDGDRFDPNGFCDTPDGTYFGPLLGAEAEGGIELLPGELCSEDGDCSDGHCYEGSCQPECDGEDDDDSCLYGDCVDFSDNGDEDYRCNVTFVSLSDEEEEE